MDFRVSSLNHSDHLSFVLFEEHQDHIFTEGAGVVLDSSYQRVMNVTLPRELRVDVHEFSLLDEGKSAIMLVNHYVQAHDLTQGRPGWDGQIVGNGFREIDLRTRESLFDWRSLGPVSPVESTFAAPEEGGTWDYL